MWTARAIYHDMSGLSSCYRFSQTESPHIPLHHPTINEKHYFLRSWEIPLTSEVAADHTIQSRHVGKSCTIIEAIEVALFSSLWDDLAN